MKIKEFFRNKKIEDLEKEVFPKKLFILEKQQETFAGEKILIFLKKSYIPSPVVNINEKTNIYMSEQKWEEKLIEMMRGIKGENEGIIKFYNILYSSATDTLGLTKGFLSDYDKKDYEEYTKKIFFIRILTFSFLNKLMKDYLKEYIEKEGKINESEFVSKYTNLPENKRRKGAEKLAEIFTQNYIIPFYEKVDKKISDIDFDEFMNKNKYVGTFKMFFYEDKIHIRDLEIYKRVGYPEIEKPFAKKIIKIEKSLSRDEVKNFFEKRNFQTSIFFESKTQIVNEIKNLEKELNTDLNLKHAFLDCK